LAGDASDGASGPLLPAANTGRICAARHASTIRASERSHPGAGSSHGLINTSGWAVVSIQSAHSVTATLLYRPCGNPTQATQRAPGATPMLFPATFCATAALSTDVPCPSAPSTGAALWPVGSCQESSPPR